MRVEKRSDLSFSSRAEEFPSGIFSFSQIPHIPSSSNKNPNTPREDSARKI
jgi:hypothetical protein